MIYYLIIWSVDNLLNIINRPESCQFRRPPRDVGRNPRLFPVSVVCSCVCGETEYRLLQFLWLLLLRWNYESSPIPRHHWYILPIVCKRTFVSHKWNWRWEITFYSVLYTSQKIINKELCNKLWTIKTLIYHEKNYGAALKTSQLWFTVIKTIWYFAKKKKPTN